MNAESQLHWCGYREGAGFGPGFQAVAAQDVIASGLDAFEAALTVALPKALWKFSLSMNRSW